MVVFLIFYRLACLAAVGVGFYFAYYEFQLDRSGVQVEARIKDNESIVTANANRQGEIVDYTAQLYYSYEGREYDNDFLISKETLDGLVRGESLTLEALPGNPEHSRVPGGSGVWGALFFSAVGAGLFIFAHFFKKFADSRMPPV